MFLLHFLCLLFMASFVRAFVPTLANLKSDGDTAGYSNGILTLSAGDINKRIGWMYNASTIESVDGYSLVLNIVDPQSSDGFIKFYYGATEPSITVNHTAPYELAYQIADCEYRKAGFYYLDNGVEIMMDVDAPQSSTDISISLQYTGGSFTYSLALGSNTPITHTVVSSSTQGTMIGGFNFGRDLGNTLTISDLKRVTSSTEDKISGIDEVGAFTNPNLYPELNDRLIVSNGTETSSVYVFLYNPPFWNDDVVTLDFFGSSYAGELDFTVDPLTQKNATFDWVMQYREEYGTDFSSSFYLWSTSSASQYNLFGAKISPTQLNLTVYGSNDPIAVINSAFAPNVFHNINLTYSVSEASFFVSFSIDGVAYYNDVVPANFSNFKDSSVSGAVYFLDCDTSIDFYRINIDVATAVETVELDYVPLEDTQSSYVPSTNGITYILPQNKAEAIRSNFRTVLDLGEIEYCKMQVSFTMPTYDSSIPKDHYYKGLTVLFGAEADDTLSPFFYNWAFYFSPDEDENFGIGTSEGILTQQNGSYTIDRVFNLSETSGFGSIFGFSVDNSEGVYVNNVSISFAISKDGSFYKYYAFEGISDNSPQMTQGSKEDCSAITPFKSTGTGYTCTANGLTISKDPNQSNAYIFQGLNSTSNIIYSAPLSSFDFYSNDRLDSYLDLKTGSYIVSFGPDKDALQTSENYDSGNCPGEICVSINVDSSYLDSSNDFFYGMQTVNNTYIVVGEPDKSLTLLNKGDLVDWYIAVYLQFVDAHVVVDNNIGNLLDKLDVVISTVIDSYASITVETAIETFSSICTATVTETEISSTTIEAIFNSTEYTVVDNYSTLSITQTQPIVATATATVFETFTETNSNSTASGGNDNQKDSSFPYGAVIGGTLGATTLIVAAATAARLRMASSIEPNLDELYQGDLYKRDNPLYVNPVSYTASDIYTPGE